MNYYLVNVSRTVLLLKQTPIPANAVLFRLGNLFSYTYGVFVLSFPTPACLEKCFPSPISILWPTALFAFPASPRVSPYPLFFPLFRHPDSTTMDKRGAWSRNILADFLQRDVRTYVQLTFLASSFFFPPSTLPTIFPEWEIPACRRRYLRVF